MGFSLRRLHLCRGNFLIILPIFHFPIIHININVIPMGIFTNIVGITFITLLLLLFTIVLTWFLSIFILLIICPGIRNITGASTSSCTSRRTSGRKAEQDAG